MVLEVNNTFDERRIYFLKGSEMVAPGVVATHPILPPDGEMLQQARNAIPGDTELRDRKGTKFTDSWSKDFHVSPFNSRKGFYGLSACDPLNQSIIDNTITLSSSQGHPKLVARIFSTGKSIDPSNMGTLHTLVFVASWWWVGFVTFPRIVREAAKLFFRRKLHVWYRPEVLRESIGRHETEHERSVILRVDLIRESRLICYRVLEECFRLSLKASVEQSDLLVPVRYTAAMSSFPETFYPAYIQESNQSPSNGPSAEALDVKITSPLFYSQLVRHSHITEFIASALLTVPAESQTFYVSDPQVFLRLFNQRPKAPRAKETPLPQLAFESLRWRFLHWLRNLSPRAHTTSATTHITRTVQDIRPFPPSMLDEFAQRSEKKDMANNYRKVVVKLLVSDMMAFGQPAVLDAVDWLIRIVLCYTFVQSFHSSMLQVATTDGWTQGGVYLCADFMKAMLGCAGVHLWWALKEIS